MNTIDTLNLNLATPSLYLGPENREMKATFDVADPL